jgi:hypothetical protein
MLRDVFGVTSGIDVPPNGLCFDKSIGVLRHDVDVDRKSFGAMDLSIFLREAEIFSSGTDPKSPYNSENKEHKRRVYENLAVDGRPLNINKRAEGKCLDENTQEGDSFAQALKKYCEFMTAKSPSGNYACLNNPEVMHLTQTNDLLLELISTLSDSNGKTHNAVVYLCFSNDSFYCKSINLDCDNWRERVQTTREEFLKNFGSMNKKHVVLRHDGSHYIPLPFLQQEPLNLASATVLGYGGNNEKRDTLIVQLGSTVYKVALYSPDKASYNFAARYEQLRTEANLRLRYPTNFGRTQFLQYAKLNAVPMAASQHIDFVTMPVTAVVMDGATLNRVSVATFCKSLNVNDKIANILLPSLVEAAKDLRALAHPLNHGDFFVHNDVNYNNIVVPPCGTIVPQNANEPRSVRYVIDLGNSIVVRFNSGNKLMMLSSPDTLPGSRMNSFGQLHFVQIKGEDQRSLTTSGNKAVMIYPTCTFSGPHSDLGAILMLVFWTVAAWFEGKHLKKSTLFIFCERNKCPPSEVLSPHAPIFTAKHTCTEVSAQHALLFKFLATGNSKALDLLLVMRELLETAATNWDKKIQACNTYFNTSNMLNNTNLRCPIDKELQAELTKQVAAASFEAAKLPHGIELDLYDNFINNLSSFISEVKTSRTVRL